MELTDEIAAEHFDAQGRLASMGNYHRWILRKFDGALGRRIWDAGAGVGIVSSLLSERCEFLLASEFTDANLQALRTTFERQDNVRVEFCDLTKAAALNFAEHKLDTIVTLDVLEHLEDDAQALSVYHSVLQPGGRLCIKVPAHPFLYGTMDEASLHFRRYTRGELRRKMIAAGFEVERIGYMNMAAVFPYLLKGRILKKQHNFSNSIDGGKLGFYNKLMPWLERAERILPKPFGLSVVAIGRKAE